MMTDWRDDLLRIILVLGVLTVAITEGLSLFGWLNRPAILGAWAIALAVWLGWMRPRLRRPIWDVDLFTVAGVGVIFALTGLAAWRSPVNNWDSMTYHLPRVMMWLQHGDLSHFPTSMPRQLFQNPFAEYAILHTVALIGSDRLANSVQWMSLALFMLAVSTIARQLGADRRGQILAGVWVVTIPMAILQASGTQNDLVVGAWLGVLVWAILTDLDAPSWGGAARVGLALGLVVLSKGTGYVLAFPFLVWYGLARLFDTNGASTDRSGGTDTDRADRSRPVPTIMRLSHLLLAALLFLVMNSGHYWRNWQTFDNPLGATEGYANELLSPAVTVSTMMRNATLNATLPHERVAYHLIVRPNRWIHANILQLDPSDERTTYLNLGFQYNYINASEDTAPSPLHFFLLFGVGVVFVMRTKTRNNLRLWGYVLALLGVFVFFSTVFKWQIWNVRLLMPPLALAGAWVGAVTTDYRGRGVLGGVLLVLSVPYLLFSCNRPLIRADLPPFTCNRAAVFDERLTQTFNSRGGVREGYLAAAQLVNEKGCNRVGLVLGGDSWEYPFWQLLDDEVQMRHVFVPNRTADISADTFPICAVIASPAIDAPFTLDGHTWRQVGLWGMSNDSTAVYFPDVPWP